MSLNIIPIATGYQEIYPYIAMNIDSAKINTSLVMMKECIIRYTLEVIHKNYKIRYKCETMAKMTMTAS